MNQFQKIFQALNRGKVQYLVVGGIAVNLYGYMRFTADLDLIIALDENNLKKFDKVMEKLGYTPRLPVQLQELRNKQKVRAWIAKKNFKAYTYNPPSLSPLQIDIIIEESLQFDVLYKRRIKKKVDTMVIPVIAISDLIGMKKKADRSKDLDDLKVLLDIMKE